MWHGASQTSVGDLELRRWACGLGSLEIPHPSCCIPFTTFILRHMAAPAQVIFRSLPSGISVLLFFMCIFLAPAGAPALSPGSHVLGPFRLVQPFPEVTAGCVCSPVLSLLRPCMRCWVLRARGPASLHSLLCVCARVRGGGPLESTWLSERQWGSFVQDFSESLVTYALGLCRLLEDFLHFCDHHR